jgi:hypothetical protein
MEELSMTQETANKLIKKEDLVNEMMILEGKSINASPGEEAVDQAPTEVDTF